MRSIWSLSAAGRRTAESAAFEHLVYLILMVILDGVCATQTEGKLRFYPTSVPTDSELNRLTHTLAYRIGRYLERQGLLEQSARLSGRLVHAVRSAGQVFPRPNKTTASTTTKPL